MSSKKVETLTVEVNSTKNISFADLLLCEHFKGKQKYISGKDVALRVLEHNTTNNTIIGIVETSRKANVPPKKDLIKKTISKLGLGSSEALVYANVFIYDVSRKLIMYEVNKNGCYLEHFISFFYRCSKDQGCPFTEFDIKMVPVLKKNEYLRLKRLDYIKSVEIEVSNPSEIEIADADKNEAMVSMISSGVRLGSTKVHAKFNVHSKSEKKGLLNQPVSSMVQFARKLLTSSNSPNIKKIIISGYDSDGEFPNKLEPIDLVADRYLKTIELNEPRENSDLLESQRSNSIKALHASCCADFDLIFAKNG